MGDEDIGGFTQKEAIDKPGIIGARWWQESIANEVPRRKAIQTMMMFGGALTVIAGVGWLASKASKGSSGSSMTYDSENTNAQMKDALEMQKTYGWNFGATGDPLVFDGTTTKPFDPAALDRMVTELAPGNAAYTPYFVPTLFQSPGAMPKLKPPGDLDAPAFQPLRDVMRPVSTSSMTEAFERGKALAAMLAKKPQAANTAIVVDLPGPDAVAFAAGAAGLFDPVFLFDNWPHPHGVVGSHVTLGAALYYQPLFANARAQSAKAMPMFVLDRNRLAGYVDSAGEFDNRYIAKLPPAAAMKKLQIGNLLYVGPTALDHESDDLVDPFLDYKNAAQMQFRNCPAMAFTASHEAFADDTSYYYGGSADKDSQFWADWNQGMLFTPTPRRTAFSSGAAVPSTSAPRPPNFGYVPVVVAVATGVILGSQASRSGSWNRSSSYGSSSS